MVAFSFTTFGNELALTKLVSEYKSRNDYASTKTFFKICLYINIALGLFTCIIMYKNADMLCTKVLNAPECAKCLQIISLGIPFMSAKGAIHGYFLGLEQSGVHGTSDFLEQLAKVLGLYILASLICVRSSYDASFAVWGIVIGEITAFLFSACALLFHFQKQHNGELPGIQKNVCFRLFLKDSIPLTTNRLALTVLQSIESIMIPTVLLSYYKSSTVSLATYGVFTGMAFPFIMFPSTITNSLSTMLLPAVSCASSGENHGYMKVLCEKSLHFCLLIGIFSMTIFYIFGADIGFLFFDNKESGQYLIMLSMLCPFIYLATTLASILNGLGYATHNLILTVVATTIRISFILFTIPKIGMPGYIAGLFVSYLFLTFSCLHKLQKEISFSIRFTRSILFPTAIFVFTGSASYICYQKLLQCNFFSTPDIIRLLFVLLVYGLSVFLPVSLLNLRQSTCKK
ncbi:MAG: polysaccharide biosynthesis C-terminal domain-containing protein [Lachnospiraceae bacterium]|nr:polysaccharide biosynthesis C-terminal domain-containing protein [Lachnospiraceae bacterium]